MLKLVLPKGSLEKATLELFEAADLPVSRSSSIDYRATIDDPRIDEVRILRPQEIPRYVADGVFDLGITGRDWIEETGSEYPELTRRFFEKKGIDADVRLSYGATEAKVPDIVDCIVDLTETGRALRAAGLKIIDTILTSYTELIANPVSASHPAKAHAMAQVQTLLSGTLEARGKVLVKLNVSEADLDAVIALVPAMRSPTVSKLFGEDGFAVETVVPKATINTLIPALKDAGASDIIELPLAKIVH
jgi:ATP phosphoribosyltransferase